jgi:nucleotide-binding universal stress UspA family protein
MTQQPNVATLAGSGVWTYPPTRILVAVDFGEASARAVQVALALSRRYGASLTALHADVIEAPVYFTHDQAAALERQRLAARSAAERELRRFVRPATADRVTVRFVEDTPAATIIDASHRADLIVMGTHGRRGPSRWWMGSVAERVIRESRVPVLVLRAAGDDSPVEDVFKRPLMVAGPWTFEGDGARYAAGLAETFGGQVAEQAATCEQDVAREREATLMVIPTEAGAGWLTNSAERLVRICTLPMLFVPNQGPGIRVNGSAS